jgi:hypothetical protein
MQLDHDIMQAALRAAPVRPGLHFGDYRPRGGNATKHDGALDITYGHKTQTFHVLIKSRLHNAIISSIIAPPGGRPDSKPLLLVTRQVGPQHADALIRSGTAFMDTAGNVFLDLPGLHITVIGRKTGMPDAHSQTPGRAFRPNGLRLLYAFLTDPLLDSDPPSALLNQNYRMISRRTGVSLGSIGWLLNDLRDSGYIIQDGHRRLVDRSDLCQKWVANYTDRLKPKLQVRRYASRSPDWWQGIASCGTGVLWGGEVAAAKLTQYLRPATATIYAWSSPSNLIVDAGLRVDDAGDVSIVVPFWLDGTPSGHGDCVHPFLVYADLLASDLDRNLDAAQRVRDGLLRHIIDTP